MSAPFASTEIAMAHDNDPGDCNDFWEQKRRFYEGVQKDNPYINSPLNTTSADEPVMDRQSLEKALRSWAAYGAKSWSLSPIIEAARKHLETLPKPKPEPPKFQVVGIRQGARETYHFKFAHRNDAADFAAGWMATGKYCSVAIEQVP
jgi:hypothetical protein